MSSTLFVSLSPVLSGSTVSELFNQLQVDIRSTDFTFYGSQTSDLSTSQQKYASAIVLTERIDSLETKFIGQLTSALQPGSSVTLCGVQQASTSELSHNLVLSGLVDVSAETAAASSVCKTVVKAKVPGWALGAKAALGSKNKTKAPTPPPANKWTLNADDEDEELIDEEELLTAEDLKRPAPVNQDDCEVGAGRKACKNCSCGRAEAEAAAVKLTPEMLENPTSACGNCSLGDAFRCASCPYRGLPSFEQGQKIQLPSNFLTADV